MVVGVVGVVPAAGAPPAAGPGGAASTDGTLKTKDAAMQSVGWAATTVYCTVFGGVDVGVGVLGVVEEFGVVLGVVELGVV
ncbi:MAG TPA: hypothetical protein VHZ02_19040, partial [Acidimicrobiales bacterium]|nr:hypothetical protein [Acidimicrobiales bacterium]